MAIGDIFFQPTPIQLQRFIMEIKKLIEVGKSLSANAFQRIISIILPAALQAFNGFT